jgi:glucose-6-phosphate 1-dehydrogenase
MFDDDTQYQEEIGLLSIVILGASGDLAKKKTFPSLFGLFKEGLLPQHTKIYGFARQQMELEKFREHLVQ